MDKFPLLIIDGSVILSVERSSNCFLFQAYRAGMLFPQYVWIAYSRDYLQLAPVRASAPGSTLSCSREELMEFLDGVMLVQSAVVDQQEQAFSGLLEVS